MNRLLELSRHHSQSPWLDNLKRSYLTSGQLALLRDRGVRGLTSNPTIFQKAIQGSDDYDAQFTALVSAGGEVLDHYWDMVVADIHGACDVFSRVYDQSDGLDGYVSVEVDPRLAHNTAGTELAARQLDERIHRRNLMIKIPATEAGIPVIEQMIAEGRNVNVTLIFSLERYAEVVDAYIAGLERYAEDDSADLSTVASVASFFISRVDVAVDTQLEDIGTPDALELRGEAALAQARLAYRIFTDKFSGERWAALARRGARVQRPLWASTGTKNPDYSDVLYVDGLIGPHTVNTLPEQTLEAFADHGTLSRTVDPTPTTDRVWAQLAELGVDMQQVAQSLEIAGVESFIASFEDLLSTLETKASTL